MPLDSTVVKPDPGWVPTCATSARATGKARGKRTLKARGTTAAVKNVRIIRLRPLILLEWKALRVARFPDAVLHSLRISADAQDRRPGGDGGARLDDDGRGRYDHGGIAWAGSDQRVGRRQLDAHRVRDLRHGGDAR